MEMTAKETKAGNGEVHPPGLPWVTGWRLCLLPRPSRVQLWIPGAAGRLRLLPLLSCSSLWPLGCADCTVHCSRGQ